MRALSLTNERREGEDEYRNDDGTAEKPDAERVIKPLNGSLPPRRDSEETQLQRCVCVARCGSVGICKEVRASMQVLLVMGWVGSAPAPQPHREARIALLVE